ncbi:alpha/beta hydrolase family protein [Aureivirga sp. CE67]|uniref:alpha/beta hydrolase family protein n=1 Tax=Aureivirga sp. CE67 TaxID=1788983 RepID=UPI0018C8EA3F|nr:alpha/beta hydrolase [Aureivirga sp. CE67]
MRIEKNIVIPGKHQRPILADVFYNPNNEPKPVVIFCHGYKGFKDWGAWNLVAEAFAAANVFFIKFNFSHNGGTIDHPLDFPDLEAFGENNIEKELDDLETMIDWIFECEDYKDDVNLRYITIVGHSRGGGIVSLKASEDKRVAKVATWSGVCDFSKRFPAGEELLAWEETGVTYVANARTNQQMPHYYSYFENFEENKTRFNIQRAVKKLKVPHLIIHGANDEAVLIKEAFKMNRWNSNSELYILENANHTYQTKHPWKAPIMSDELQEVVDKTIGFVIQ